MRASEHSGCTTGVTVVESSLVMQELIQKVEDNYRKKQVVDVRSGDTVRVHQKIKEGEKERIQIFEGFVIRTDRKKSLTSRITVRRISGGIGVEKSFLLHSPLVTKVEVMKRSKVRRKNLSFMRNRSGKSARLAGVTFDKEAVNTIDEIIDAEVGEFEESENTDVTKKEKSVEKSTDVQETQVAENEKPAEEKTDDKETPKSETDIKEEEPEVEEKVATPEENKELTKKEKAEAFRKSQEEKNK